MKKGLLLKTLVILALSICMLGLLACVEGQADKTRFDVELEYGYGNNVKVGTYAPFYVEITNNGKDFEGSVQMIIPGRDGNNVMYEKDISLQAGGTKTVELVGRIEQITRQVNIRVANSRGDVIWSSLENCTTMSDFNNVVNIGVLSDDYTALGYMDHKTFSGYTELSTRIYELSANTFPTDWHALDMLDVIVISDFSTDALSEEQLNALGLWVSDGGLLMVGTGSTSNKTLASLNGRFFDVEVGELEKYETKFGLYLADFSYVYSYEDTTNSAYGDELYATFYEQNYETMRELFEEEYMEQFKEDYYYDDQYDVWDEYWEDSFYWYCFDVFYKVYLESLGQGENGYYTLIEEMPYVKADILTMEGPLLSAADTQVFEGENKDGKKYDLAYAIEQGNGYIFLCAADFTKTPFSNYEGNSIIFVHWIESLIGEKCYNAAMNYTDYINGYYNPYEMLYCEEEILNGASSATVPPIMIYVLLILAYIIAILVVYLVSRHKKKTVRLWVLYPIVAAGLSILIFCIGFSTRIYRPVVGAITLIMPNGSASVQRSYVAVTVPGNQPYDVGFSPSQSVEYVNLDYSYYYYGDDEVDYDSYEIGYKYGYDSVDVTMGEQEAMGNVYFRLDAVASDQRNIIITSNGYGLATVEITNAYGCDLENAAIIMNGEVYVIGDMANGETVQGSSLRKETEMSLNRNGLGSIILQRESGKSVLGWILGSVSNTYDEYLCKLRALNSVTDYVDQSSTPDIVFVAIPSEDTAVELQGATNYNERRVEIIYAEYDFFSYGQ